MVILDALGVLALGEIPLDPPGKSSALSARLDLGPEYHVQLRTWTWSYNLNLIGQDAVPPGKRVYDLPAQPQYPVWLRTWTAGPQPQVPQTPFRQTDWPNPRGPEYPISLRTFIGRVNTAAIMPPGKILLGVMHQQPRLLQTWINNGIRVAPMPFRQQDWPVPRGPVQPIRGWIATPQRTPGGTTIPVSLVEAAAAADAYSVFISRASSTRPPARRDAWDRDDWGRWVPGAGIRQ